MKAVLVIDLEDDVNLDEVEIRYAIQHRYGMPVKTEVDGCPLRPLPTKIPFDESFRMEDYAKGWNACLEEITE